MPKGMSGVRGRSCVEHSSHKHSSPLYDQPGTFLRNYVNNAPRALLSECPAAPCPALPAPTRRVVRRASAGTEWIETKPAATKPWNQKSKLFRGVVPFRLRQAHQEAPGPVVVPRLHGAAAAVAPGGRGEFEGRFCAPMVRGKLKPPCRAWG